MSELTTLVKTLSRDGSAIRKEESFGPFDELYRAEPEEFARESERLIDDTPAGNILTDAPPDHGQPCVTVRLFGDWLKEYLRKSEKPAAQKKLSMLYCVNLASTVDMILGWYDLRTVNEKRNFFPEMDKRLRREDRLLYLRCVGCMC